MPFMYSASSNGLAIYPLDNDYYVQPAKTIGWILLGFLLFPENQGIVRPYGHTLLPEVSDRDR
jgi:hypothetical protein